MTTRIKTIVNQRLSMGEGNTPLLRLSNIEKLLNWRGEIWAKAEYQNPTGSFKDRGSLLEIKQALKKQKKGVVCASTGNMAASLAAYAARINLPCYVVVPTDTPNSKLSQALVCGAKLIKVNGNYDQCIGVAEQLSQRENFLLCGDYKIRRIGQRSMGEELVRSKISFDAFVVPVGNGTLGAAIAEGFAVKNLLPRFIGVQGKGADPITRAWLRKTAIDPIDNPRTIASAMMVGKPLDGDLTLGWVKKTKGIMISVGDKEILVAHRALANREGIYVEKSAAATLAGLIKLKDKIKKLKVVLILTGSGLKEN